MAEEASLSEICAGLAAQTLPRWAELPDLELYMDQVLSLIERYLGGAPGHRGLTASMVNNYVKLGVMPPPVKKKYTRVHLAHLIVICVLKASLPIESIGKLAAKSLADGDEGAFYDRFCARFEAAVSETADAALARDGDALSTLYDAALRAQAEQTLALELYETIDK